MARKRATDSGQSAVAAVDKDGVVESVTIDPLGEEPVRILLTRDLAPEACEKLLTETAPGILAKVGASFTASMSQSTGALAPIRSSNATRTPAPTRLAA